MDNCLIFSSAGIVSKPTNEKITQLSTTAINCVTAHDFRIVSRVGFVERVNLSPDGRVLAPLCTRSCMLCANSSISSTLSLRNISAVMSWERFRLVDRSSKLRFLSLVHSGITRRGLADATGRLPFLEELHLYFEPIGDEIIKLMGRSCTLLKSFTLSKPQLIDGIQDYDGPAVAIAKTMPQLRHLCLFGNGISNQGLVAILDCCTCLKSLDLRQCTKVDLEGDLAERCTREIQSLKKPSDSTADFEYENEVDSETSQFDHGYGDFY